jgi:spermidine synthase
VLLVGGGVAGDLREVLKHPIVGVTYVELDPLLIEAARAHLPARDAAVLNDPRVALVLADGRLYVRTAHRTSDVVILDLPEPATGALNRFYTREFFAEVRAVLAPGGVFSLGLPSAENYWSPELARRNGSVYHTLRAVFPEVVVLPGEHNFFLASDAPLETDPAVLARRQVERGVETQWVTPGYIEYVFTTDRFAAVQAELEGMAGVRLNRDLSPICYYYDLVLWLSRFYPNLRGAFESASMVNLWWVATPLALIVLLVRWRAGAVRKRSDDRPGPSVLGHRTGPYGTVPEDQGHWAIPFVIATVGLAGMMMEVIVLFAFQVLHGTIYAEVSLMVTAFMAGLALGGAAGQWLAGGKGAGNKGQEAGSKRQEARGKKQETGSRKVVRRALVAVQGGVVVYSGVFPSILSLPIPVPTLMFPLLALIAGLLTGMAFPLAVALMQGSASRVVGSLYGADLVGGCVGALLGAVFLVPVLGIPQTCAAVALVGLAGLLALVGQV